MSVLDPSVVARSEVDIPDGGRTSAPEAWFGDLFGFDAGEDDRAAMESLRPGNQSRLVPNSMQGNGSADGETEPADAPRVQLAQSAMAADLPNVPIGRVEKISGGAMAMRNGASVALHTGDAVFKGDVVETGTGAGLTIKFVDGTVLALSSSARVALNEMAYAAGATSNSVFFRIVEGVIGLVAGASAKGGDFAVETPTAIMGIRGTAVRIEILPDGSTKFSLLREPNGSAGTILLLDKADRSRIIGTVSDTGAAAIVAVVTANQTSLTRVTKTAEELRSEGALIRDLFQLLPEQRQRRGSGETGDDLIVPAFDLLPPPDAPELGRFATVQSVFVVIVTNIAQPTRAQDAVILEGEVTEDGPAVALGIRDRDPETRILPPATFPHGVTFNETSGRFRLDPSNQAYQHLGEGETQTVLVRYTIAEDGELLPATVSWIITGRNDNPVARADKYSDVGEVGRTILAVRSNDRDVDGDRLAITSWTNPLEGSVSLDRAGRLVFDPGDDFEALSAGQTATVLFEYTISDGHGGSDTATAVVTVRGEGIFSSPAIAAQSAGTLTATGQAVAIALTAPARTTAASADVELVIDFGLVPQRSINIVYVVDVSGSTGSAFAGEPVGDLNQDGRANTILDAEIAGLIDLTERVRALGFSPADVTVTLIPFNHTADPTSGTEAGVEAVIFDLGFSGDETIGNALRTLRSGGRTDFETALQAAIEKLAILDPERVEENFVTFVSDGAGTGFFDDEVDILEGEFGAQIAAVGIGGDSTLDMLAKIDTDGQVMRLVSRDGIDASFIGLPHRMGEVIDVDLTVNRQEVAGIGIEDLVSVGDDFMLQVEVGALARFAGESNKVVATVTFAGGLTLTTEVDVFGALPRSTDFSL